MEHLAGRTAVVTGGASGIGLGTARLFAAESMNVLLADVEPEALAHAVADFDPDRVEGVVCDVTSKDAMDDLAGWSAPLTWRARMPGGRAG